MVQRRKRAPAKGKRRSRSSAAQRTSRSGRREVASVDVIVRLAKVFEIVLADVGLTMNQFRLLTLVRERSPSAAELSLRLVMKPPNVSVLTSGLARRGLIEQSRQSGDGRRRTLSLTAAGSEALAGAHERCGLALRFLAAASPGGETLLESLQGWLPALDDAAVRLREEADGRVSDGSPASLPRSTGRSRRPP